MKGRNASKLILYTPGHSRAGIDSAPRGVAVGPGKRRRWARVGRTGSGCGSARMAVAAMTAAAAASGGAGAARSLSRFRGCLAGALLGDCVGAVYEARDTVDLTSVLRQVQDLEPDPGSAGSPRTGGRARTHWGTWRPRVARDAGREGTAAGVSGRICRTCGHLGLSLFKSEPHLHESRPRRLPVTGLATPSSRGTGHA